MLAGSLGAAVRYPRAAWILGSVGFALTWIEFDDLSLATVILVPVHAFAAARRDGGWGGFPSLIAFAGVWVAGAALTQDAVVPAVLIPGTSWLAGRALRERERVAAQLAERALELEGEREAYARLAVRFERARIASELHDIVAHAISVMVVQAGAGQRLASHDPQATAETFEAIAGAAREAEQDMGRLVALLGDDQAIGPAPDLALLEELVARAAGSGLNVTLRLEGDREGLPAALGETAYRVVQEGLTNALRYAAGAPVSVLLRGAPGELVVEVENGPGAVDAALAGSGTGNGLRGLRERVTARGGTLRAGSTQAGGWILTARLRARVGDPAPQRP
jgi:signal transduction histidine kinase